MKGFGGSGNYGAAPVRLVKRFGYVFLIASLIAAFIFSFIGEKIIKKLVAVHPIPGVGVYFGAFGLVLMIMLFIGARILSLELEGKRLIVALISLAAIVLLGMLFEFLYEIDFSGNSTVAENVDSLTSYLEAAGDNIDLQELLGKSAEEIADLFGTIEELTLKKEDLSGSLLSYRLRERDSKLYPVMRIVFFIILGMIIAVMKAAMLDESADMKLLFLSSAGGSVLGALLMEFLTQKVVGGFVSRLLMVFLFGVTIVTVEFMQKTGGGIGSLSRL